MMRSFAELLERLVLTPSRNRKIGLLVAYFRSTPDPDRGFGLGAITGDLDLRSVKPALIRQLVSEVTDPELVRFSYDFVGDLAETVALIWPTNPREDAPGLSLSQVVDRLNSATRTSAPSVLRELLDGMPATQRYAMIKLATGALRIGVSARLAKQALAQFGDVEITEIEEIWHSVSPPYRALFKWLEGKSEKPRSKAAAPFRPVMLSHPLEERDRAIVEPRTHQAEWKWDGVRVQAVCNGEVRRLYSRTGDDISHSFPDLVAAIDFIGAIDGELLVRPSSRESSGVGTFSDLQQRLNRKIVDRTHLTRFPVFIRAYDVLIAGNEDVRDLALGARRKRLERLVASLDPFRFDLSEILPFQDFDDLARLRDKPPHPVIEGLMLKRLDSPYLAGRPRGPWYKWKRDPHLVDAVLLYAQRGHGKRSGFYSDFTFGVWRDTGDGEEIVPVGKAYFGFTDDELRQLDRFVRENTVERFGPVRSVRAEPDFGLVLEIAFEGLQRSTRHKSGIAMRFPRISRIRWDKPPAEADRLENLTSMLAPDA